MSDVKPIAIPWYKCERDYLAVVAMLPASERQNPPAYDAFMAKIVKAEQEKQREGFVTVRVPIDAVTVKGWCDANNIGVCRNSLTEYAMICATIIMRRDSISN